MHCCMVAETYASWMQQAADVLEEREELPDEGNEDLDDLMAQLNALGR